MNVRRTHRNLYKRCFVIGKMLSRKFLDVLSIVFIISVILIVFLPFKISPPNLLEMDSFIRSFFIYDLVLNAVLFIYWLFIVVLIVQLYSLKKVGIISVILVIVLVPIAIIHYLLTFRGILKGIEEEKDLSRLEEPQTPIESY